ncbi:MAG: hypothetical protein J6X97_07180 [Lachnospiraceae bacterium]|nr:hypothetical protein [Lachnospiraceae bacterium]
MSKEESKKKNIKKQNEDKSHKRDTQALVLKILFVLTPCILSLIFMAVKWIAQGYAALPGIKWNDEAVYIKLIETYSGNLAPKGYWGFDGNHAIMGTGSAWSPAILAPYFIPAIIFPVGYSFVYICNMVYVTAANAIFMVLTKPDKKNTFKLILAQVTSIVFILYLNTNMSEMFRYALAIVIAGLLYRMFFDNCPKWLKYVVTPLLIVYAVQVYTFFAFCIPIYVFALLAKKKLWVRILVSVIAMGFIATASYGLLHLISSNYNIGKTEALLSAVSSGHIFAAFKSFLGMMRDGFKGLLDLRYYVRSNGVYIFHVLIAFLIIVSSIITFFSKGSSEKDKVIALTSVYSICIFFLMYLTLYTIVPDTFMRGTEIAIIFCIYLLMMTEDKYFAWTIILCNATGLLFLPVNLKNFQGTERYYRSEVTAEWKSLENELKDVLTIKDSGDPWDNTVIMYTMEPKAILAMPEGLGINFVLKNDFYGSDAEYIFLPRHEHFREDWIEHDYSSLMTDHAMEVEYFYEIIYENSGYVCYRKKDL